MIPKGGWPARTCMLRVAFPACRLPPSLPPSCAPLFFLSLSFFITTIFCRHWPNRYLSTAYYNQFTCCEEVGVVNDALRPWLLATLLDWHATFPPTADEARVNDVVFLQLQGNRNPFIDFPHWAEQVFGTRADLARPPARPPVPAASPLPSSSLPVSSPPTALSFAPGAATASAAAASAITPTLPPQGTDVVVGISTNADPTNPLTVLSQVNVTSGEPAATWPLPAGQGTPLANCLCALPSPTGDGGLVAVGTLNISGDGLWCINLLTAGDSGRAPAPPGQLVRQWCSPSVVVNVVACDPRTQQLFFAGVDMNTGATQVFLSFFWLLPPRSP